MEKPEPTFLAWLAGIIDGEGCVKIRTHYKNRKGEVVKRPRPSPEIVIGMTCFKTIYHIRAVVDFGTNARRDFKNRTKPCYFWAVYGDNARTIASWIEPYSITKHNELLAVIATGGGDTNGIEQSLYTKIAL